MFCALTSFTELALGFVQRARHRKKDQQIRQFHEVLQEEQSDDVAAGTGMERNVRWTACQAARGGQVAATKVY